MLPHEAKFIVDALASGVDPETGEILSGQSIFNQPSIIRALFLASRALDIMEKREKSHKSLPDNAGNSWLDVEDAELLNEFKKGLSLKEIANRHGRTLGAINSRLSHLGVEKDLALNPPEAEIKSSDDDFTVVANNGGVVTPLSQNATDSEAPQNLTFQNAKVDDVLLVRDLQAEIEDSRKVVSQKDCDEFIKSISELSECINDVTIRGNAKRRVLELERIRLGLPSEKESKDNDFVMLGLKRLKMHAPKCVKCGVIMLLQQNNKGGSKNKGDYFWGCQNFALPFSDPKHCGMTKQLSKLEKEEITPTQEESPKKQHHSKNIQKDNSR